LLVACCFSVNTPLNNSVTADNFVPVVPTCKDDREELLGALKHETVTLRCEVDANPHLVTFHWTFNNSGDLAEVPPSRFTSVGSVSRLNYTPVSDMDYGTLACWGSNAVGHQRSPCIFQVVAAGNLQGYRTHLDPPRHRTSLSGYLCHTLTVVQSILNALYTTDILH
jgi:hypothetical protein